VYEYQFVKFKNDELESPDKTYKIIRKEKDVDSDAQHYIYYYQGSKSKKRVELGQDVGIQVSPNSRYVVFLGVRLLM